MSEVDQYFDAEIKAIAVSGSAIARAAAEELYDDVRRQIRRNFHNPSLAFEKGLKVEHYERASYVRLSPILSSHAEDGEIQGSPNLWILLPDGVRLGFKRIGKGFGWSDFKRRFGTRLSFAPVNDGHVVLFRDRRGVYPIYKIQRQVKSTKRIEFFEKAEEIAEEMNR